jgi:transcriptional regulator with XRE-family HTH domain
VINLERTGRKIEALRKKAGLSVRDLQEIFGFGTPQAIYKWQHGQSMPTIDNLVVLSRVFHVPIEEILELDQVEMLAKIA